jgi:acyl carrier protein
MTNQDIEQKVREILAAKLGIGADTIRPDSRLAEDLGVDSFGAVELMFEIEEAFGLKIPDSEIGHVRSVDDIVAYLSGWLSRNPQA